jgi:hypothetical protein
VGYTAVDTYDITSDTYPIEVSVDRRGVRTPWEGPLVSRRQTFSSESAQGQAAVRTFTISYRGATKAQYNRAMTLWKKSFGGSQGLNYSTTNLAYSGTENIVVRMVAAPFLIKQQAYNQYSFRVVLEEMLHAP